MKKLIPSILALSSVLMVSCEKKELCGCSPTGSDLPETYNFENVNHSGQDQRLDMLQEVIEYMETASDGAAIDEDIVYNMFVNQNYTWKNTDLNNSTKDLASKASDAVAGLFGSIAADLQEASTSGMAASNGVAGTMTSTSGKTRVFNAMGLEPAEFTEKLTMGSIFYYQAVSVYLSDAKMNVDNETVEPGEGTAMQHHWDEAFGYWGVPNDFGTAGFTYDKEAPYHRYWAKYTHVVNQHLNVSSTLMNAFIKGRDAINRKDYPARDAAITEVRDTWETIVAAMAIHYLNGAKANIADDMTRNHELSEGAGFLMSLQFAANAKLSGSDIEDIMEQKLDNFYEVSVQDLNEVRDQIANVYGLTEVKNEL